VTAVHCPTCHIAVPGHSKFCLSCGSQVSEPSLSGTVAGAPDPHPLLGLLRTELAPDYAVEREVGRGGMAVVFLANEVQLARAVAIKVLPPEMALAPNVAERFKREARMAASLDHPNIIPVYRVGQAGGVQYMVQKYIEGRSLEAIIAMQGALPISVTLHILRCVTSALAFAHGRGIIHRDIKGANILIDTDGRIVVSDFGIARAVEDVALTASGAVVGTPAFMSPEQCSGQPLGPQCDQYSLGVVAFQMVTGSVPFMAPTLPAIMQHHFFTPVPDIERLREGVPHELRELIVRSLEKKPENRYASTDDMLAAVETIPFSDSTRKRAEAALRELARGVGIGRISLTGPGRGDATVVRDIGDAAAPPGTPEMLDISGALGTGSSLAPTRPMASDPSGATASPRMPSPVSTAAAPVAAARARPTSAPLAPRRRLMTWLAMAGIAVALFVVAAMVLRQNGAGGQSRRALEAAQPFVDRAMAAKARGDAAAARRELSSALEIAPRHPVALREMGTLMYGVGNFDLARSFLLNAVRADPNDRAAMQGLACSLVRLRRPEDAQRFFDRAGGQAAECR
jgi:tetratricopeptide (TPR) repeat protein